MSDWSDVVVNELPPTGTVTLLSAGVEGFAPQSTTPPWAQLERAVADLITTHRGVCTAERSPRGGNFVVGFARASDAVSCALALQRAPSVPLQLRIGVHTGEVHLHHDTAYTGSTLDRSLQLRDLAHVDQILLSGVTADLVSDRLPPDAWLADLGSCTQQDGPRLERVVQACHHELPHEFPPLRGSETHALHHVPEPLTSFVGRQAELGELQQLVCEHRLLTLTGTGGVGKTRLAVQLSPWLAQRFDDGVRWVDLAPITDPALVAVRAARTLGLPDQPGRSTLDTLKRSIGRQHVAMVLDNCEQVAGGCAELVTALLSACPALTVIATSRESLGVPGEVTWNTPSLSLTDEAVELFTQRAQLARPDFTVGADGAATAAEICRQLDGVPLAIELAAARVRTLSLDEVIEGLQDRLRLLNSGVRTVVPRQQTLRASVDWSHALLSEPEQVVFRRLAVFVGGFDLSAACAVAADADADADAQRYRILDQLTLLVDKSLMVADDHGQATRYRLLETVRQFALEKLAESGEGDVVRTRHRDHYTALFDAPVSVDIQRRVQQAVIEINNLRAAFVWSREHGDIELAAQLASSLQPLWLIRGRIAEGLAWFDSVLADTAGTASAARARALADTLVLDHLAGVFDHMALAEQALTIARGLGEPDLLARVLTACGVAWIFSAEVAVPYFAEALELARSLGDDWQLSWILGWQADSAYIAGDPVSGRAAAEEGLSLANQIGDEMLSRMCRWFLGCAHWLSADLAEAVAQFGDVATEAGTTGDPLWTAYGQFFLSKALAYQGDTAGARAAAEAAVEAAADLSGIQQALSFGSLANAFLAAGDVTAAGVANDAAWQAGPLVALLAVNGYPAAKVALAQGDVAAARRLADESVATAFGAHRMILLTTRVRVSIAEGDVERAERDARDALTIAADTKSYLTVPGAIECLATLAAEAGDHRLAARLFGSAAAMRSRTGEVRFKIYDADYESAVAGLHAKLTTAEFDSAWAEGAALSTDEAIAYAQRGRGERKRPSSGWASLTPTELDVVRLVSQGMSNKNVGAKLLISPRTVQAHLTHVYTKLGIGSRMQLAQEAARHS